MRTARSRTPSSHRCEYRLKAATPGSSLGRGLFLNPAAGPAARARRAVPSGRGIELFFEEVSGHMAFNARKQPLYDQLVDILTEKIEHEFRPGDLLPSERELSDRYSLSRTTVRLALQELERLGLVVRQHGRGTFVADRSAQTANLMSTYSFSEQMREMGRHPETTILEFSEIEADKNLAEHMGCRIGERVYKLKRLRSADGMPLMVERTYLPVRKFLALKRPLLESKSLYAIIENDYREKIRVAEEEFFASIARPADARLLDIAENAPVLDLVRTTYSIDNEIVEYTLSVARADQFKYKVYHKRMD